MALKLDNRQNPEEFQAPIRRSQDCPQVIVGRQVDIKGDCGEVSDRSEEHIIGHWRKGDPCYKVSKDLAEQQSHVVEGQFCE